MSARGWVSRISWLAWLGRSLGRTWAGAWLEAWANRRSFWLQVAIMVANDVVWILFWVLFFGRIGSVRGWDVDDVLVLLAVLTTSGGIVLGLVANVRRLGEMASDGGLDAALSLPVPTLPHLLSRRVDTSALGDLVFGLGLFAVAGDPTPTRTALFAVGVVCSALTMTGFLVLMGSSGFFLGRNEAGDLGFQALVLFSAYPVDLFAGMVKFFLYAVVPAGFVSALPARMVSEFEWRSVAAMVAAALAATAIGWTAFTLGLRRYTSGSSWTDA